MNKKKLHLHSLALAIMVAASSLAAATPAQGPGVVTLTNTTANLWTAAIGNTPNKLGAFTDVYTFTPSTTPGSTAWATVENTSFWGNGMVTFQSADLNGNALFTGSFTPVMGLTYNFATLPNFVPVSGPLVLTIHGTSVSGGSYGGDLTVTMAPVPEPETYGMMMAGMGVLAFLARRRRQP